MKCEGDFLRLSADKDDLTLLKIYKKKNPKLAVGHE